MLPLQLRPGDSQGLEAIPAHTPFAEELGRAQALLWLSEGQTVAQVAELLRVSRQTVYNWVQRFHERQALDLRTRLRDAPRGGRPPTAKGVIDPLLGAVIGHDPRRYGYRCAAWAAPPLRRYLRDARGIRTSRQSIGRGRARLRLRWNRPRHQLARRPATRRQAKGGSNAA
jgi:transposase